jgi:glycosyltransferase involved in cell wall biosynthesis
MSLPTLHLIAPFHTQLKAATTSSCAFSMKSLRFAKMMRAVGYRVMEYANAGSESEADEKVVMLTQEEFDQHYPAKKPADFVGGYAVIGERGWPIFHARLITALLERLKPGDIVCHQFGRAHEQLPSVLPNVAHCEIGVGYPDVPFGCWRIFESETWRAYHWGRDDQNPTLRNDRGSARSYSWVIPNYFYLDDWPEGDGSGDYVLYMGRITPEKGMTTLVETIKADAGKTRFVFAGQGDFDGLIRSQIPEGSKVDYLGVLNGRQRAEAVGNARCMVMPTQFVEPFGGAGVEGMLCGTPLIASNFGAFVETVNHGITGYRCNTLADWMAAIEASRFINRKVVSAVARAHYSLETCAKKYDAAFRQIADLSGPGWYSPNSYRIP